MTINRDDFLALLDKLVPDAKCELLYRNVYELTIAVVLSAQTTDVSVNKVTPFLFRKYPDFASLKDANVSDVEAIIKSIGLYKIKAKRIVEISRVICEKYHGEVPGNFNDLTAIKGIGRKTANVILVDYFRVQAFPVDTHIHRIALRLKVAEKNDSLPVVEEKLKRYFGNVDYRKLHHQLIAFGRYYCTARTPENYIEEIMKK